MPASISASPRVRPTPFSDRVEALGVKAYTVYNRMLLATSFRSLEEDYWHLRRHVQLWDVSVERQVELRGPDAAKLIQMMTPRNLSKVAAGRCVYAPLTDATGGMINDPVILKLAEDRFWVSIADSDVILWARGLAFGLGYQVEVFEPDVYPLAVQGPKAEDLVAAVFGEAARDIRFFRFAELEFRGHRMVVARSGWSKQGGFEIYVDREDLALPLWDALWDAGQPFSVGIGCPNLIERIEGGLLSYGNDFTREHTPLECGLDQYCDLSGAIDFIGREAILGSRDAGLSRQVRGLRIRGGPTPDLIRRWPVRSGRRQVGWVSSAVWSPSLKTNVAIAMIDASHWQPGKIVKVDTPDGERTARVTTLPFKVPRMR